MPDVRPNVWLSRRRQKRFSYSGGFGLLALNAGCAIDLAMGTGPNAPPGADSSIAAAVFFLIFAIPTLFVLRRTSKAGVWLGADGVVIRGPLRTRRIPLEEAESFAPGVQRGAGNGTPAPGLIRRDGDPVFVWALGREGWVWNMDRYLEELGPLCDELNEVVAELKGTPLPRGPLVGASRA